MRLKCHPNILKSLWSWPVLKKDDCFWYFFPSRKDWKSLNLLEQWYFASVSWHPNGSIEWFGARLMQVTFSVEFFSFKTAWSFACAFQFSSKTLLPCLAYLHLISEKNKDKILKHAQQMQQGCFFFFKSSFKTFRHFWRKKNSPEKVTYISLAPCHLIIHSHM